MTYSSPNYNSFHVNTLLINLFEIKIKPSNMSFIMTSWSSWSSVALICMFYQWIKNISPSLWFWLQMFWIKNKTISFMNVYYMLFWVSTIWHLGLWIYSMELVCPCQSCGQDFQLVLPLVWTTITVTIFLDLLFVCLQFILYLYKPPNLKWLFFSFSEKHC